MKSVGVKKKGRVETFVRREGVGRKWQSGWRGVLARSAVMIVKPWLVVKWRLALERGKVKTAKGWNEEKQTRESEHFLASVQRSSSGSSFSLGESVSLRWRRRVRKQVQPPQKWRMEERWGEVWEQCFLHDGDSQSMSSGKEYRSICCNRKLTQPLIAQSKFQCVIL